MAKRDVDLVIRARDEASAAAQSVGRSLKQLVATQDELVASGAKVDSSLTKLKTSLTGVDASFKSLKGSTDFATKLDRSAEALGRIQAEVIQTKQAANAYSVAATHAASATGFLTLAAGRAAAALAKEKLVLTDLQARQARLSAELAKAAAAKAKLATQEGALTSKITAQGRAIDQAKAKYAALAAAIKSAETPTNGMISAAARLSAAILSEETKLQKLNATLAQNRTQTQAVSQIMDFYGQQVSEAGAKTTAASAAYVKAQQNLDAFKNAVSAAAANQRKLVTAADAGGAALSRLDGSLAKAKANFAGVSASVDKFSAEMKEAATTVSGSLTAAIQRQQTVLDRQKQSWAETTAAIRGFALALKQPGANIDELNAKLTTFKNRAGEMKAKVAEQAATLNRLKQAFQELASGVSTPEVAIKKFEGVLAGLAQRLQQASAVARSTKLLPPGLTDSRASADVARLHLALTALSRSYGATAAQAATAARSMKTWGDHTRTSLNWTQRLTAQVRSLFTAYIGIFGAIRGVKALIDATLTLSRAQSRLGVIFEGDLGKTEQELDFLRRTADRLGISFGVLADQYTLFASSTLDTNIAGQKTRDIFTAIATAATVVGLSTEDVQGVFKALGQIASKGVVQMEELRGQLGDRMPAALKLMADGLGITVAELMKATKAGDISADALVGFADKVMDRYGRELPAAMERLPALFGKLSNAIFKGFLQAGEGGGFIDGIKQLVKDLTTFAESAQGAQLFKDIGIGLKFLLDLLVIGIKNIKLIAAAFAIMIGLKVGSFFMKTADSLSALLIDFSTASGKAGKFGAAMTALGASFRLAGGGVRSFGIALKAVFMTNPIGFAIGLIAIAVGLLVTRTNSASEALSRHTEILNKAKTAFDAAGNSARRMASDMNLVTEAEVAAALLEAEKALKNIKKQIDVTFETKVSKRFGLPEILLDTTGEIKKQIAALRDLKNSYTSNKRSLDGYRRGLGELARATTIPGIKALALELLADADAAVEFNTAAKEMKLLGEGLADPAIRAAREAKVELDNAAVAVLEYIDTTRTAGSEKGLTEAAERDTAAIEALGDRLREGQIPFKDFFAAVSEIGNKSGDAFTRNLVAGLMRMKNSPVLAEVVAKYDAATAKIADSSTKLKNTGQDAMESLTGGINAAADATNKLGVAADGIVGKYRVVSDVLIRQKLETERARLAAAGLDTSLIDARLSAEKLTGASPIDLFAQQMGELDGFYDGIAERIKSLPVLMETVVAESTAASAGVVMIGTTADETTAKFSGLIGGLGEFLTGLTQTASTLGETLSGVSLGPLQGLADKVGGAFTDVNSAIVARFGSLESDVNATIDRLVRELARLEAAIAAAQAQAAKTKAAAAGEGKARGGPIWGRGTGTSDSIVARLSTGEYVLSARAVRKWGHSFLNDLNHLRMPRFAAGGAVGGSSVDLGSLLERGKQLRPIIIPLPTGDRVEVMGSEGAVRSLARAARASKATSGGRKPTWYGST